MEMAFSNDPGCGYCLRWLLLPLPWPLVFLLLLELEEVGISSYWGVGISNANPFGMNRSSPERERDNKWMGTSPLILSKTINTLDALIIKDRGMFRILSYNQRMVVRHCRNDKWLLKRTIAALEKQIRARGLDGDNLHRAEGSTLGVVLPG